jgi:single-strand DNA-binding protein
VASTPRKYDRETNQWQDGEPMFLRCNVWREQAENAAQTLTKGQRVIVSGRLKARTFDTEDGGRRTVLEIDVEDVGPSLRYASAQVTRTQRTERPQQDTPAESGDWGAGQVY